MKKEPCAHLELKETKNMYQTFATVKGTSLLAFSVYFCTMNNLAELQLLSMMQFSFNTLSR